MLDDGGLVDPTRLIHVLWWVQFPHRLLFLHYDNAKKMNKIFRSCLLSNPQPNDSPNDSQSANPHSANPHSADPQS